MRDSGNTWDQIAKHMNELSIPTARGGKWHGKTVLNAHQRLTLISYFPDLTVSSIWSVSFIYLLHILK